MAYFLFRFPLFGKGTCAWLLAALSLACTATTVHADPATHGSSQDPSSYANVDQFQPSHFSLDFAVNFADSTTSGTITHTLTVLEPGAGILTVYFDVWDAVEVSMAEFAAPNATTELDFAPVEYAITTPNPNIGNALAVALPVALDPGAEFFVRFTYKSLPETTALDWLSPEQTAGKALPFVYSLCQMNFCRDWAPMMDTPSQKITFDATVVAPKEVTVIMSGTETSKADYNDTHSVTTYEANLKIPSYQLSLAVGGLERVALSDRLFVVAEPPYLEAAAREFEDLPAALDFSEDYLTPYIWGAYSIIVMPPSFPWGGMEHVNANQVSHTLIAGDKSMLKIAIHEITHSWFGNDVGCKSWNHFWINEGLNVFMERKVLEFFYSKDYAAIDYFTGNTSMVEQMDSWYGLDDPYSSLFPDIGDDDPENSFSDVPYEKGSQFLYYIESLIGMDAMQRMLQDYILTFTQQAIDATEFKSFYESWVMDTFPDNATDIIDMTMWDVWVYEPGVAPVDLGIRTDAINEAILLADEYVALGGEDRPPNYMDYFDYYPSQMVAFVQHLKTMTPDPVDANLLAFIDMDYNITFAVNPEVRTEWFQVGIRASYDTVLEPAYKWMGDQGRIAFVRPTYRALAESDKCDMARAWFDEYRNFYNSYVFVRVEAIVNECEGLTSSETQAPTGSPAPPADDPSSPAFTRVSTSVPLALATLMISTCWLTGLL